MNKKGQDPSTYTGKLGKPKGAVSKVPAEIKDMIRGALEDVGGRSYLMRQAELNPMAFMGLIGKIIPKDVNNTISGELSITKIKREIVHPKHTDSEGI